MGGGKENGDVGMDQCCSASKFHGDRNETCAAYRVGIGGPLKLNSSFQLSSNCSHTWLPEEPLFPPPWCAGCKPRAPEGWPSEPLHQSKGLRLHAHIHYEHVLRMPLGGAAAFPATSYGKVLSRPALQGLPRTATSLTWITVASPS